MRRRPVRTVLFALAALVVLLVAAGAIALARFNPNSLKPRIVAAVQQATGRSLALNGPISLHPALWPTVELRDVSFANPPGFSRPAMATLQRLDLQVGLWALLFHHVDIERLVLVRPDIRLETNAKGESNWRFGPQHPAAPAGRPAVEPQPSSSQASGTSISVDQLRIESGTLSYRNDVTGRTMTLAVRRFAASARSDQGKLHVTADAQYDHTPFTLTAQLGTIERLLNTAATTPWPVQATVQAGATRLTADGSIRQPLQGRDYDVALIGNIPDLAALDSFAPGLRLPPLRDVRFSTRLRDRGGAMPDISALTLKVGASDLGTLQPGLKLQSLEVTAPNLQQAMQVQLQAELAQVPLQVAGTLGPPADLLAKSAPAQPYPVDLSGHAGGASLVLKGNVARPATLSGVNLQVQAQAADLAGLSTALHRPLPALKSVAFSAQLTDLPGGLAKGVALHGLKLAMPQAELAGTLSLGLGAVPDVTAQLTAQRIDADALLAAFRPAAAPAPATAAPPPAPAPAPATQPLFPDTPLPFALLRRANANITLAAAQLISGGADYRNLHAHLLLQGGKLRLDPFAADSPAGHLALSLNADATAAAPPVALTLRAPALALKPLFAALHAPDYASGTMEVLADLHGAGRSPHAIAADLNGSLGLAMQHGTVDVRLLEKLLGPALAKANLLDLVAHGGTSQVECFAFRMDAQHGVGTVRALALSSSLLSLDGAGSVNLGQESVALTLRPQGRVGGAGFVVPLQLTGSLRNPSVMVNAAGLATSNLGSLAGTAIGSATPLGALAGLLGGSKAAGEGVSCAGPLAIARGQAPPAQPAAKPAAPAAPAAKSKPAAPNPADLLRQLFR